MKREMLFKWLLVIFISIHIGVTAGTLVLVQQMGKQIDQQQIELNAYRTLVFNLYGKDGG